MTAALFPAIMLLVFAIMLLAFCYEPKSEIDPLFAGARPYLSRAQIDRAIEIELHALSVPCEPGLRQERPRQHHMGLKCTTPFRPKSPAAGS